MRTAVVGMTLVLVVGASSASAAPQVQDRQATRGNEQSRKPLLSTDGRYLAFESFASNLVPDDTNAAGDVFVTDLELGTTQRLSVDVDGHQVHGHSFLGALSADGRHVSFLSEGRLTPDACACAGLKGYLYDLDTQTLSYLGFGSYIVALSGDGSTALIANTGNLTVWERPTDRRTALPGEYSSFDGQMSADGRRVAFTSSSRLTEDDADLLEDVYAFDVTSGSLELVSAPDSPVGSDAASTQPTISADGGFVVFVSRASNITVTGSCTPVDPPNDLSCNPQVYVRDLDGGVTELVSAAPTGTSSDGWSGAPTLSADGRFVAFMSDGRALDPTMRTVATNGARVFVRDRLSKTTLRAEGIIDRADPLASVWSDPRISPDGRLVASTRFSFVAAVTGEAAPGGIDIYLTSNPFAV